MWDRTWFGILAPTVPNKAQAAKQERFSAQLKEVPAERRRALGPTEKNRFFDLHHLGH
jgi:hypothetical protein